MHFKSELKPIVSLYRDKSKWPPNERDEATETAGYLM